MRIATLVPALLLGACGVAESAPVDDAANPPRWGLWQVERMPTRIIRNGVEVPMGESRGHGDERFTDVYGKLGLSGRKDLAALTLLADALKGTLAVLIASHLQTGVPLIACGIAAASPAMAASLSDGKVSSRDVNDFTIICHLITSGGSNRVPGNVRL